MSDLNSSIHGMVRLALREELAEFLKSEQLAQVVAGGRAAADQPDYLREEEAAEYLRIAWSLLRRIRKQGRGPAFSRCGRLIRYARADLVQWMAEQQPGARPVVEVPPSRRRGSRRHGGR